VGESDVVTDTDTKGSSIKRYRRWTEAVIRVDALLLAVAWAFKNPRLDRPRTSVYDAIRSQRYSRLRTPDSMSQISSSPLTVRTTVSTNVWEGMMKRTTAVGHRSGSDLHQ